MHCGALNIEMTRLKVEYPHNVFYTALPNSQPDYYGSLGSVETEEIFPQSHVTHQNVPLAMENSVVDSSMKIFCRHCVSSVIVLLPTAASETISQSCNHYSGLVVDSFTESFGYQFQLESNISIRYTIPNPSKEANVCIDRASTIIGTAIILVTRLIRPLPSRSFPNNNNEILASTIYASDTRSQ